MEGCEVERAILLLSLALVPSGFELHGASHAVPHLRGRGQCDAGSARRRSGPQWPRSRSGRSFVVLSFDEGAHGGGGPRVLCGGTRSAVWMAPAAGTFRAGN